METVLGLVIFLSIMRVMVDWYDRKFSDRQVLAHAKQQAYSDLFSQPGRPARTSKSQGKSRLYKL